MSWFFLIALYRDSRGLQQGQVKQECGYWIHCIRKVGFHVYIKLCTIQNCTLDGSVRFSFFYIESVLCRNRNTEQNIPADRKKGEMDRGWVCYKDLENNMCRMLHRWQHITTYTWKPGFSSGSQSGWHAPYGGIELLQGHHVLKLTSSRPKCDEVYHTRYIRENQWVAENLHWLELDFERQTNVWEFSVTPWFRNNICLMRLRRTSFHVPGLHTKVFIYGE